MKSPYVIAAQRGVTRLCHFAPFKNVHHILPSGAILSSFRLANEHPGQFNPTDPLRLDNRETHICTTIEYPNVWYLDKLQARDDIWIDYGIFLIDPIVLDFAGTEFCYRNAGSGVPTGQGSSGFMSLYDAQVRGQIVWRRSQTHPLWLPTDMQAEVLIEDAIPLHLVRGVVVVDKSAARRFLAQVRAAKCDFDLPLIVSPGMFSRVALSSLRNGGARPSEELYNK